MAALAIELNDVAITGVDHSGVVFSEPGYAVIDERNSIFGDEALKIARLQPRQVQNRYWHDLSESALARPIQQFHTQADLVHAQLERLWLNSGGSFDAVFYAIPPYWNNEQLGLLLGISEELKMPVAGLADSAIAASRRHYESRDLVNLESSLHELTITRVNQDASASLAERRQVPGLGIEALERAAAEFIARQFLEQSRFDALHDAKSEQMIYDNLYRWLAKLNRQDRLSLDIAYNDYQFQADVEARELRDFLRRRYQPVVQQLRSMLGAGRPTALQVSARLGDFPGVVDTLLQIPDCAVYALEPGAPARGMLRRQKNMPDSGSGLKLVTALPWDQAPVQFDDGQVGDDLADAGMQVPTHILYQGRAYRLGAESFSIGSELSSGVYGLVVGGPNSGVSRRHCTVQAEKGRVTIHDHSRYGTMLNGFKIDGSAILQQGDVLGIGTPLREFQLVAEVVGNGA